MGSEEIFECRKQGNERYCLKLEKKDDSESVNENLTEEETKIAEAAKQAAIEVLQDALKKKESVLMKLPKKVVLQGAGDSCWMKRHAILTEDLVKKLLEELKKVRFKKDISKEDSFAFVFPDDETRTIYFCKLFWNTENYLSKNFQPGTLIHEVTHFLGTNDSAYGNVNPLLQVGCKGVMIKDMTVQEKDDDALWKAFWNADNVEYEFEFTINHKGSYVGGKYSCCGETARYSVCNRSVPESFHTCRVGERLKTRDIAEELCHRSKIIKDMLLKTAEELEGYLRKAEASRKAGLSMGFAGGAGAAATLLLAPATLGIPVLVAGGVGVAGAGVGLIATKIFKARANTKEKELKKFFADCQTFLDDVTRTVISLNNVAGLQRDFGVQRTNHLINQVKEAAKSERNYVQKIHIYVSGITKCANFMESVCKLFSKYI